MNTLSAHTLGTVIDCLEGGITLLDHNATVLHWNRWLAGRSGIDTEQAHGRALVDILPSIIGTRLEQALGHAIKDGLPSLLSPALHGTLLPLYQTAEDRRREQRMHQLIHVIPLRGDPKAACMIQISDVTANISRERVLRQQTETLRRNTTQDALTGLANRQSFDETLSEEFVRAAQKGQSIALLIGDIDAFNAYNTAFGREQGDKRLKQIAKALLGKIQSTNQLVARYGGDEFAIILPDTDEVNARQLAGLIQRQVGELVIPQHESGATQHLSISIGASAMRPEPGDDTDTLLASADVALYQAKSEGRNQAVFFSVEDGSFRPC